MRSVTKLPQASLRVPPGQPSSQGQAIPAAFPPQGAAGTSFKCTRKSKAEATGRSWTPADKELIADMRAKRISHEVIAQKFGVTSQRISQLALRWGLPVIGHTHNRKEYIKQSVKKPEFDQPTGEAKIRRCLMGDHDFLSNHIGHRVCEKCKSNNRIVWQMGC